MFIQPEDACYVHSPHHEEGCSDCRLAQERKDVFDLCVDWGYEPEGGSHAHMLDWLGGRLYLLHTLEKDSY